MKLSQIAYDCNDLDLSYSNLYNATDIDSL